MYFRTVITYTSITDSELIGLLKSGDHASFQVLYERHWGGLYIHALKMLDDEDEAKDVVQEVFIGLWNKKQTLDIKSSPGAYLFSAVRNKVLNLIRDKKTRAGYIDLFSLYIDQHSNEVLEGIQEKELLKAIEEVIQSLPEKMKKIFELSRKEHLSHRDISEKLDISEKTVKRQVSNALHILRDKLDRPENLILALILYRYK